jgi:hypothetical protein
MKSFVQFILEQSHTTSFPWKKEGMENRVWRVDPPDRSTADVFNRHDYAIYDNGTSPLPSGHNVKPGDKQGSGGTVRRVLNLTFASPGSPNAFYGAFPRKGADGNPVRGVALFDQDKMWGKNRDPNYKGQIHTTAADWNNVPRQVAIHSAHSDGWSTDSSYSGMEEVTSEKNARDVRSHGLVNTRKLVNSQYNVVIHPDHETLQRAVEKIQRGSPQLSRLDQGIA